MSRKDEAKSATGALYRNISTIDDSCFMARGQIADIPENESAIKALEKNNLAYFVDDAMGVQVHSTVRRLLNHVTKRYRLRETHQAFAGMIEELRHAIQNYQFAKNKSQEDKLLYQDQIHEFTLDIMSELTETVQSFAHVVGNEFSTISNIDIRIRETTRCKNEIAKLNEVFSSLSVADIRDWAGADLMLERLLMKTLKSHVDKCLKELSTTAHRLLEMIAKLIKDKEVQRLNQLIDSFYTYYQKNPSYTPDLGSVIDLPPSFNRISSITINSRADIDSAMDEETLSDIAISVMQNVRRENIHDNQDEEVEVKDGRGETIEGEIDTLEENVDFFFDALLNEESEVSELTALKAHELLEVDAEPEDWMLCLMEHYEAQKSELIGKIKLTLDKRIIMPFNGNHYVRDISFRRVDHG
jgi:hypothetical protein